MELLLGIILGSLGAFRCMEPQIVTEAERGGAASQTYLVIPKAIDEFTTESVNTVRKSRGSLDRKMEIQENLTRHSSKITAMKTECRLMRRSFAALDEDLEKLTCFGVAQDNNIADIWEQLKKCHSYVLGLVGIRLYKFGGLDWKMLQASPEEDAAGARDDFAQCRELPEDILTHILEDVKADWLRRFVTILHSVTFPFIPEDWDDIRQIKVCFEKCVFQSIQFLFKFNFINKRDLRTFFLTDGTLELTGDHLFDIFQSRNGGIDGYHTFKPDMGFILTNWQTAHLHEALAGLTKIQRGFVLYRALLQTIQAFIRINDRPTNLKAAHIYNSFMDENFYPSLRKWQKKPRDSRNHEPKQDFLLKSTIQSMIYYFEGPPDKYPHKRSRWFQAFDRGYHRSSRHEKNTAAWDPCVEAANKRLTAEYLLNYHLLHWIQTYHGNYDLSNHFRPEWKRSYELFKKLMKLLEYGMKIQVHIKNIIDYSYLLSFPPSKLHTIPRQVSREGKHVFQRSLKHLTLAYIRKEEELRSQVATKSSKGSFLYYWLYYKETITQILGIFNRSANIFDKNHLSSHWNLWMMKIEGNEEFEAGHDNENEENMAHLKKYYMLRTLEGED